MKRKRWAIIFMFYENSVKMTHIIPFFFSFSAFQLWSQRNNQYKPHHPNDERRSTIDFERNF